MKMISLYDTSFDHFTGVREVEDGTSTRCGGVDEEEESHCGGETD